MNKRETCNRQFSIGAIGVKGKYLEVMAKECQKPVISHIENVTPKLSFTPVLLIPLPEGNAACDSV